MERWIEYQNGLGFIRSSLIGGIRVIERCGDFDIVVFDTKDAYLTTIATFKSKDDAKAYIFELFDYIKESD